MSGPALVGVDVGGTTIKGRVVRHDGTVLETWAEPTPAGDGTGRTTIETIVSRIEQSPSRAEIAAVGVVVPGIVDETDGVCIRSVNLGWNGVAVAVPLRAALGVPVAFGHDVRAGALAEARTGASSGVPGIAAFVALGTGLAAAYTRDRRLLDFGELAGEVGQVRLLDGPHAGSTVEEVASAGAIARRMGAPDARTVAELVRAGDPAAVAVWRDAIVVLCDAVAWITVTLGPAIVVIGGGLSASTDLLLEPLAEGVAARVAGSPLPAIVAAHHGAAAGVIGATELAANLVFPTSPE